ncbi:MAG: DNA-directed RNA polymerase subunit beta [Atopostipes sp.]|nr:DNA-directed RNA polymerase subunit beta [Atopostipes sp.]
MDWKMASKKSMFFILRFLLVVLVIVAAFVVGGMFGYSIIGDGGNPLDVFDQELWQHILSFFMN